MSERRNQHDVPIDGRSATRIAFLFPSLARGGYWQPVLAEFAKLYPNTVVLTGIWEGFLPSHQGRFQVQVVGQARFIRLPFRSRGGQYHRGFIWVPLHRLLRRLWRTRPHVVFASGFSVWTFVACMLKAYGKWKVVLIYDGSSPSVDRVDSPSTLMWRRFLARCADAFISNTSAGKKYLQKYLAVPLGKVFIHPYEVPDPEMWGRESATLEKKGGGNGIVFITVGRVVEQKGLRQLIEAVRVLRDRASNREFSVIVVGDGPLRADLEAKVREGKLSDRVNFVGHVEYRKLGHILRTADVFVFPTLEDVWGLAPLEAMAMGKPVLCSKYAGASEVIDEGVNGWVFDPYDVQGLAELMRKFLDNPELASTMGRNAQEKMKSFTPESAAQFLGGVVKAVLGDA